MGLLDKIKKLTKGNSPIQAFPLAISEKLKDNPYANKFSNESIETSVYLLYSDFSDSFKWIKDAKKPDVYFKNYIKSIQILTELITYTKHYKFKPPTPMEQLTILQKNYSEYTNKFIARYWNVQQNAIKKLKTDKGKQSRTNEFFDIMLNDFGEYLTSENITYINSLKSGTCSDTITNKSPVNCNGININSVDDIKRIPKNKTSLMRPLQKAATDFKRNGDMLLAVECLKKSNEISDNASKGGDKLLEKEYLRVIKYLKYANMDEELKIEESRIKSVHPEFYDKRISNLPRIFDTIKKAKEFGEDTVLISTNNHCELCSPYNNKIFSISGKNKKYPPLPKEFSENGGFCPECIVGICVNFDSINS